MALVIPLNACNPGASGDGLSPYDWLLARRTVALGIALGTLVFFVMLGTDEGLATVGGRLGRLAALVSLAGGAAAFIATEQARCEGELRALGAAGVPPIKASMERSSEAQRLARWVRCWH